MIQSFYKRQKKGLENGLKVEETLWLVDITYQPKFE